MLVERIVRKPHGLKAPKMDPGNKMVTLKTSPHKHPTSYPVLLLPLPLGVLQYIPTRFDLKNAVNIKNALQTRLLAERKDSEGVVVPDYSKIKAYTEHCRRFHRFFRGTRMTEYETFMDERKYSGAKRARYEKAHEDFLQKGMRFKDSYISAFLKDENQCPNEKQARVVQSRGYVFALRFGMHLHAIEKQLYRIKGWSKNVKPTYTFGKGHCPLKRAKVIGQKWSHFAAPECTMFDLTAFDSTLKKGLLKAIHELYRHCSNDAEFEELMRMQLTTRGYIGDFMYKVGVGGRCSGDFDTSLGNAYVMATALSMYATQSKIHKWDMYCDGDDTLFFTEKGSLNHTGITDFYKGLGMILRVEGVAHCLEDIKWCQNTPVFVRGTYRMIPDPRKKISHLLSNPKMSAGHLATLAQAETALSNGVPILGAFAQVLARSSQGADPTPLDNGLAYTYARDLSSYKQCPRRDPVQIDHATRVSFAKAYGYSVEQQVALELLLDKITLDPTWSAEVFKPDKVVHPDFGIT